MFARDDFTQEYSQLAPHPPVLFFSIPKATKSNFKAKLSFQVESHGVVPSGAEELQGSWDAQPQSIRPQGWVSPLSAQGSLTPKATTMPYCMYNRCIHKPTYCLDCICPQKMLSTKTCPWHSSITPPQWKLHKDRELLNPQGNKTFSIPERTNSRRMQATGECAIELD